MDARYIRVTRRARYVLSSMVGSDGRPMRALLNAPSARPIQISMESWLGIAPQKMRPLSGKMYDLLISALVIRHGNGPIYHDSRASLGRPYLIGGADLNKVQTSPRNFNSPFRLNVVVNNHHQNRGRASFNIIAKQMQCKRFG